MEPHRPVAVVAGLGPGLGASLGRTLCAAGFRVAGLARREEAGRALEEELGEAFLGLTCDLTDAAAVARAIDRVEERFGGVTAYLHNAAEFLSAPFADTAPADFERLWRAQVLSAVHGAQRVLPGMLARGGGTLIFTGATAAVKAGGGFAAFASAKFALRGLAQSLAREYGPRGIHVAHVLIDGLIWGPASRERFDPDPAACLQPEAIAESYLHLIRQHRSAWTQELDLRPDVEGF